MYFTISPPTRLCIRAANFTDLNDEGVGVLWKHWLVLFSFGQIGAGTPLFPERGLLNLPGFFCFVFFAGRSHR